MVKGSVGAVLKAAQKQATQKPAAKKPKPVIQAPAMLKYASNRKGPGLKGRALPTAASMEPEKCREWTEILQELLRKVKSKKDSMERTLRAEELLPALMRQKAFTDIFDVVEALKPDAPLPHAILLRTLMELPQGCSLDDVHKTLQSLANACQWPSHVEQEWFLTCLRPIVEMFLDESVATMAQRGEIEEGTSWTTATFSKGSYRCEVKANAPVALDIEQSDCVALSLYEDECLARSENTKAPVMECFVSNTSPLVLWYWNADHPVVVGALDGQLCRVAKLAKRTTLNRMMCALHMLCEPARRGKKKEGNIKERLQQHLAPSDQLKKILLPYQRTAQRRREMAKAPPQPQLLELLEDGKEPKPGLKLNESQERALNAATDRTVTLIQGPPGTGKTTTCVQILRRWAMMFKSKRKKWNSILATSGSNIAVDNLVEGLVAVGIKAVRVGRPESMRPEVSCTVLENVAMRKLGVSSMREFKELPEHSRKKTIQEVLSEAEVICCTTVAAGGALLKDFRFPLVLVDEASQVTEPATLIPICHGCQQLVLCGDHCQLPPTVKSDSETAEALKLSLFERLALTGVRPILLNQQYRMHPLLSGYPAAAFYDGHVKDAKPPEAFERPRAWPFEKPLAVVSVETPEVKTGHSYVNQGEADKVCQIISSMLDSGQEMQSIGIICAYDAQVKLVRQTLNDAGIATGRTGRVEVTSVDGFQGREKDVILFSTVRSGSEKGVGFLRDWRRANVGLTRARLALAVVCNAPTLAKERSTWLPWLHWARQQGCFEAPPGLPRLARQARPVGVEALRARPPPVRARSRSRSPPPRWVGQRKSQH